ncbi:hypothetical protein Pcinc_025949 [Petrolisthes cinctipes]|uniref:Acetylcholine receptor subunit alpha-like 1 n=1 Tax=Petrolisthes cinctipes TaxID=88211 RepID=A0AAE1F701_PETCI|nr:hypothetical protein Pcinc_025949 [Petrolisthes cinctipes]
MRKMGEKIEEDRDGKGFRVSKEMKVDLQHLHQVRGSNLVDPGIDLNDYYISVEWDILKVPALRNERFYPCCQEPYPDIYFNITMRRKTLFYTVNLIIPCVGISFLSVLVFYLPSDSGEKVSLCISILLSLTVFFLLLAEIIPPTSLAVPLLGKYLLFTMILVTLSVMVTIGVLNVNFRSPSTHKMAPWVRKIFIDILPKFLWVERPSKEEDGPDEITAGVDTSYTPSSDGFDKFPYDDHPYDIPGIPPSPYDRDRYGDDHLPLPAPECHAPVHHPPPEHLFQELEEPRPYHDHRTLRSIEYIAQHMRNVDSFSESIPVIPGLTNLMNIPIMASLSHHCLSFHPVSLHPVSLHPASLHPASLHPASLFPVSLHSASLHPASLFPVSLIPTSLHHIEDDWRYVAMVLDRLFLWIFMVACVLGTCGIIFRAPSLYDTTAPIDILLSKVAQRRRAEVMGPEE